MPSIAGSTVSIRFAFVHGSKGYYAAKQDVNYKNEAIGLDVLCPSPNGFIPGKYLIDIICDDVIVGQTSIMLK
jgi:hypothetical protein